VTIPWPRHTLQAGDRILEVFAELGARVDRSGDEVTVAGGDLRGADLDLRDVSELTCVVAALLALAEGPGRIRGVAHVRGHETDRLHALETELTGLGGRVRQTSDGLVIDPAALHGGTVHTWADHRMAHAAAVLGLVVPGVVLDDVGCTTKTIADFPGLWRALVSA
jgi:3-phosphoshikimate 1-carboxyvinyltransferase